MKAVAYFVIKAMTIDELQLEVAGWLVGQGFEPQGGVAVDNDGYFYQAMVRRVSEAQLQREAHEEQLRREAHIERRARIKREREERKRHGSEWPKVTPKQEMERKKRLETLYDDWKREMGQCEKSELTLRGEEKTD